MKTTAKTPLEYTAEAGAHRRISGRQIAPIAFRGNAGNAVANFLLPQMSGSQVAPGSLVLRDYELDDYFPELSEPIAAQPYTNKPTNYHYACSFGHHQYHRENTAD